MRKVNAACDRDCSAEAVAGLILPAVLRPGHKGSMATTRSPDRLDSIGFKYHIIDFGCGWSLLSQGVAERKRLDLGNLSPIYERKINKLDVFTFSRLENWVNVSRLSPPATDPLMYFFRCIECGWCIVLLMRYLGIVWGPGYPREHVGAVLPPNFSKGRPGWSSLARFTFSRFHA